jgi:hypothetical protein
MDWRDTSHPRRGSPPRERDATATDARRRFLNACGRFAAATPPIVTMLLADHHGRSRPPEGAAAAAGVTGPDTTRRPVA